MSIEEHKSSSPVYMIKKNYPVRFTLLLFLLFHAVMLTAQNKQFPATKNNVNNDKEKLLALSSDPGEKENEQADFL
jgi:hypothetical protein